MNYVDENIIGDTFTLGSLLQYSGETGKYDLYMPHKEYTSMLCTSREVGVGSRDENGRPMFQFSGIRFYSISEEDANKYRVLK